MSLDELTNEDTQGDWPKPTELLPAEAASLVLEKQEAATTANKVADKAKKDKQRAELIAKAVLEHYELDSIKPTNVPIMIYTQLFRVFSVADEGRFTEWEIQQDEDYYQTKRILRTDVFNQECHRRYDDSEALPPGVVMFEETRLHRRRDAT